MAQFKHLNYIIIFTIFYCFWFLVCLDLKSMSIVSFFLSLWSHTHTPSFLKVKLLLIWIFFCFNSSHSPCSCLILGFCLLVLFCFCGGLISKNNLLAWMPLVFLQLGKESLIECVLSCQGHTLLSNPSKLSTPRSHK